MRTLRSLLVLLLVAVWPVAAQDIPQTPFPPDARYFDFWAGDLAPGCRRKTG